MAVRPDVIVRRTLAGFAVEVQGFDALDLRVNPQYRRLYDDLPGGPPGVTREAARRSPTTRSTSSPMWSGRTCS